jgi:hypothetical protein
MRDLEVGLAMVSLDLAETTTIPELKRIPCEQLKRQKPVACVASLR